MDQHILVIEDNPPDAALIREYLKGSSFSHKLYETESLREGLSIIDHQPIDLVLLDLTLSDSQGFSTLRQFLQHVTSVPVIVMTGMNSEIVGMQAVRAGAQDFLVKGEFSQRSLLKSIRFALQRFRTQIKWRETAKELTIQAKRNEDFQQIARIGHWEMDLVSLSMTWNEEMYRLLGFQTISFQPSLSDYLSFVLPEERAQMEKFFHQASLDGNVHQTEHRIRSGAGRSRLLSVQAKAKQDEFSEKILLIGSVQDITEQRDPPPSTDKPEKDGFPVRRNLFPEVGFGIQKPMATIPGLLEKLKDTHLSEEQSRLLESLRISFDDLLAATLDSVNATLISSTPAPVRERVLDLNQLFDSLQHLTVLMFPHHGIQLRIQRNTGLPDRIVTAPQLLTQLLYSLITCIMRHSPAHSEVLLQADLQTEKKGPWLVIGLQHSDCPLSIEALRFMVHDETGAEQFSNDHHKFSQYLSIAAVNRLTRQLAGRLEFSGAKSRKKQLKLLLPVSLPAPPATEINRPNAVLHVLLVDDHAMSRIAIRRTLTEQLPLVRIEEAGSGLQGIRSFQKKGFDLILLDLHMPVMDGLQTAGHIRSMSNVPIFSMTSHPSQQEAEACRMAGIEEYLTKPVDGAVLLEKILKWIA